MFNLAFCTATTCDFNVHTEVGMAIPVKFIQTKQCDNAAMNRQKEEKNM